MGIKILNCVEGLSQMTQMGRNVFGVARLTSSATAPAASTTAFGRRRRALVPFTPAFAPAASAFPGADRRPGFHESSLRCCGGSSGRV